MAIKIYEKFAPRANPADGDYPYGSIKNESVPGAKDGTPLDASWGNDMLGFTDALLDEAGIVPNGTADTAIASQRLDAVKKVSSLQAVILLIEQWGYTYKGTFAKGFTYSQVGDAGVDSDNTIWIYVGAGAPNKVVEAGTVPSVGAGYEQVTFNEATHDKYIMDYIPKHEHESILNHTTTYNCTYALLTALSDFPTNSGQINFPAGLFNIDPIDLRLCRNISFRGANDASMFPYSYPSLTVIRAASAGEALILTASTNSDNYNTGDTALISNFTNLVIDAYSRTQYGITTARGTSMHGCTVQGAILDGVTLESGTYPVWLSKVFSRNNGRDGVRVKAPFTTIYNMRDCEFSYNAGNGMTILDGSTSSLKNIMCQGNAGNGFEVYRGEITNPSRPIFLERIVFEQCYTEDNKGWGLLIHGYDTNPETFANKISQFTFINSSFNSSVNKRVSLKSMTNPTVIGTLFVGGALDPAFNTTAIDNQTILGNVKPTHGVNLTAPTCSGIKYSSSPLKSSDPNTLDVYAEGVFTPKIGKAGTTYFTTTGTPTGRYQRVGDTVHCWVNIKWIDKGGASEVFFAKVEGLPFQASGSVKTPSYACIRVQGGSTDNWAVHPESDYLLIVKNNSTSDALISDLPAEAELTAVFSYKAY